MVIKRHLNFARRAAKTEKRYGRAIEDFLQISDAFVGHVPNSAAELNFLLGEYVNHCHADDIPLQNAVDSLAAVRKYLPAWRDSTTIARCFLRNWSRTLTINRALPLPCNVIEAMTSLALLQGNLSLAGALYIGFVGLLRTGEILGIQVRQVVSSADKRQVVLSLPKFERDQIDQRWRIRCLRGSARGALISLAHFFKSGPRASFSDLFQCAEP